LNLSNLDEMKQNWKIATDRHQLVSSDSLAWWLPQCSGDSVGSPVFQSSNVNLQCYCVSVVILLYFNCCNFRLMDRTDWATNRRSRQCHIFCLIKSTRKAKWARKVCTYMISECFKLTYFVALV